MAQTHQPQNGQRPALGPRCRPPSPNPAPRPAPRPLPARAPPSPARLRSLRPPPVPAPASGPCARLRSLRPPPVPAPASGPCACPGPDPGTSPALSLSSAEAPPGVRPALAVPRPRPLPRHHPGLGLAPAPAPVPAPDPVPGSALAPVLALGLRLQSPEPPSARPRPPSSALRCPRGSLSLGPARPGTPLRRRRSPGRLRPSVRHRADSPPASPPASPPRVPSRVPSPRPLPRPLPCPRADHRSPSPRARVRGARSPAPRRLVAVHRAPRPCPRPGAPRPVLRCPRRSRGPVLARGGARSGPVPSGPSSRPWVSLLSPPHHSRPVSGRPFRSAAQAGAVPARAADRADAASSRPKRGRTRVRVVPAHRRVGLDLTMVPYSLVRSAHAPAPARPAHPQAAARTPRAHRGVARRRPSPLGAGQAGGTLRTRRRAPRARQGFSPYRRHRAFP